jgi:hypothetical protein
MCREFGKGACHGELVGPLTKRLGLRQAQTDKGRNCHGELVGPLTKRLGLRQAQTDKSLYMNKILLQIL